MGSGKGKSRRTQSVQVTLPGNLRNTALKTRIVQALQKLNPGTTITCTGYSITEVCNAMGLDSSSGSSDVRSIAGHLHSMENAGIVESRSMTSQFGNVYWSLTSWQRMIKDYSTGREVDESTL